MSTIFLQVCLGLFALAASYALVLTSLVFAKYLDEKAKADRYIGEDEIK